MQGALSRIYTMANIVKEIDDRNEKSKQNELEITKWLKTGRDKMRYRKQAKIKNPTYI